MLVPVVKVAVVEILVFIPQENATISAFRDESLAPVNSFRKGGAVKLKRAYEAVFNIR
jgi:hypothetical protein